ncbi:MAG: DUF167 domain-containing protein [Chloroflexi bacterium]|nr:DUF167 domain-containing protein [Chloroflexota bacterium]
MRVKVHAHPGAARERIALLGDGSLAVWVRAPAQDGRANAAIQRAVAAVLGVRPREVVLIRGTRGREKLLEVPLDATTLQARLAALSRSDRDS